MALNRTEYTPWMETIAKQTLYKTLRETKSRIYVRESRVEKSSVIVWLN